MTALILGDDLLHRDTEIAKIPAGLINSIKLKYPMVVSRWLGQEGKLCKGKGRPNDTATSPGEHI